jgi:hypothetical protein
MYQLKRYNEILFISDTCQAFTMSDEISVPNLFSVGSSLKGQNSYASHTDSEIGQSVIDRYSKSVKDFVDDAVSMTGTGEFMFSSFDNATVAVMERLNIHDALVRIPTMHGELGSSSQVGFTDQFCSRSMNKVPLSDFFAAPPSKRYLPIQTNSLVASLWMNDAAIPPVRPLDECNGECILQMEPGNARENKERFHLQHGKVTVATENQMFNMRFLAVSIGFTVFVLISLGTW